MTTEDLKSLLPIATPVLGGLSAILGLLVWLVRHQLESKNEQIKRLEDEKRVLEAKVEKEEAYAEKCEAARDAAVQSIAPLTSKAQDLDKQLAEAERRAQENKLAADKYKSERNNYWNAYQSELKKRQTAEEQLTKASGEWKTAEERAAKAEADALTAAESARARQVQSNAALLAADKARDEALGKLDGVRQERDRLAATVSRLEKQIENVVQQDGQVWNVPVGPGVPAFVPLGEARRTPVISVLNLKGGVGKTTITANLAGYMSAELGKRVLLLDFDHQRSLTQLLLPTNDRKTAAIASKTVQDFLLKPNRTGVELHAVAATVPGLGPCSLVTNSDPQEGYGIDRNLDDVEMGLLGRWLVNTEDGEDIRFLLRAAVQSAEIAGSFDYVFIDCPPRLTTACMNALTASDFVLIPTQPEANSIRSVPHLLTRLKGLRDIGVLDRLQVLGIVANMASLAAQDKTSPEGRLLSQCEGFAKSIWGTPVKTFKSKLRDSASYASASRVLESTQQLKLAVESAAIREQFEPLFKEIEGRINEVIGAAGVSS